MKKEMIFEILSHIKTIAYLGFEEMKNESELPFSIHYKVKEKLNLIKKESDEAMSLIIKEIYQDKEQIILDYIEKMKELDENE